MMKWGRKKPSSPSISHVFPMSWLSKFKQKGSNTEHTLMMAKQKAEPNLAPVPASWKDGRFYGGGDDSYWRLSFGEDRPRCEKSTGGLQSVWYDSDDELQFALSSSQNCRSVGTKMAGQEKTWKFNDMVAGVRKLKRELPRNVEISPEIVACNEVERGRERKEFKEPRRKAAKDQKLRKTSRRVLGEKRAELERQSDKAGEKSTVPVEKDIFELQPIRIVQTTEKDYQKATASVKSRNSNMKTIGEDGMFEGMNLEETDGIAEEKLSLEWQKLKEMKIREVMSKSEKQRKSVYMSREVPRRTKQSSKVRVYSPRIKALEDMKKAKMKMKKKAKEVEDRTAFDSFAVVKSSFDPQQDFRNSMIEMINEKGIRRAEELEELLACYLTLNADEYHDLIIKVFRKVWFDLNQECFGQMNIGHYS